MSTIECGLVLQPFPLNFPGEEHSHYTAERTELENIPAQVYERYLGL